MSIGIEVGEALSGLNVRGGSQYVSKTHTCVPTVSNSWTLLGMAPGSGPDVFLTSAAKLAQRQIHVL